MKTQLFGILTIILSLNVMATESPYKGEEKRDIKALSQQEIEGYLSGKGLGFAKAAELNQYPGPKHVLDLANALSLTEEQIIETQVLFNAMSKEASSLGEKLVNKEQELDQQFANASVKSSSLKILLSDIGTLQTQIRYVHLSAHLKQKKLLNEHQTKLYDQLRGYAKDSVGEHVHSH